MMRLTERSMRRIADDLHADDRSRFEHGRWVKERETPTVARLQRVLVRRGWLTRFWRLPSAGASRLG